MTAAGVTFVVFVVFALIPLIFFLPPLVALVRWWWRELVSAWRGEW